MKKTVVFLSIILLTSLLFAKDYNEEKLRDDISEMIVKHQDAIILNTKYDSEDLWWSSCDWVSPWSLARYHVYLIKDITYITYTLTDGPKVKVYWKSKYGIVSKPASNKIIFYYTPKKTGKYYYHVASVSMDKESVGIHISYLTMLYKKGADKEKTQRLKNFIIKD